MIEQRAGSREGVRETLERDELERLEINLLLEGIFRRYGFDFREYAPASLKRRLWRRIHAENLARVHSR